jgi:DNA-binding CsgD family transcriptional regulator
MTAPSTYLRQLHEEAARRRLEIAKLLRNDPTTTNKKLAEVLNVSRNTITQDRKAIVEQLKAKTMDETELLRADMVQRLESLTTELELHRKDGKLPVSVIHEALLVTRSIIELLGVRKPVVEKLEIKKRTLSFNVSTIGPNGMTKPKEFSMDYKQLTLGEGNEND